MKQLVFLFLATALFLEACSGGAKSEYTQGGFRYVHHKKNGGAKPQPGEYVYYKVSIFADDSLVYNSRDEAQAPRVVMPEAEQLKTNPSPVIDVLYLMSPGDSLTLYYPLDSMPQRPPGYEDKKMIRYDIVLDSIQTADQFKAQQEAEMQKLNKLFAEKNQMLTEALAAYKAGTMGSQLQKTESGLEYAILEEGDGPKPQPGQIVTVEYIGVLKEDGKKFDESITRDRPFSFTVGKGQVIPGWDEGLQLLNQGSKAVLFIPYQLAYGEAGSPPVIPEKADLVFYVELTDVQ